MLIETNSLAVAFYGAKSVLTYVVKHIRKGSLPKRAENPLSIEYYSELDESPVLRSDEASYNQFLIIVMRWIVEKGCIDIDNDVSILSLYLAMSRKRHFEAELHVMGYLKLKHGLQLAFDTTFPNVDQCNFCD